MDLKTSNYIVVICIVLAIIGQIFIIYMHMFTEPKSCETCKMLRFSPKFGIHGYYNVTNDFYCVWTKDRKIDKILKTEVHEKCHALVDNKEEHFCYMWYNETDED